ncbi:MAG: YbhB/YbcL family Raf kinase inhibitor-like protein [Fimbriimonadaceae bacterium]
MNHMRFFLSVLSLLLLFVLAHAQATPAAAIDTKFYYRLQSGTTDSEDHGFLTVLEGWSRPALAQRLESHGQLWKFVEEPGGVYRLANGLAREHDGGVMEHVLDFYKDNKLMLRFSSGAYWMTQTFKVKHFGGNVIGLTDRNDYLFLEATEDLDADKRLVMKPAADVRGQMWVLEKTDIPTDVAVKEEFTLTSTAFQNGTRIPIEHTGVGTNTSPPLAWKGAPAGTKSFMIICTDPDAPSPANPDPNPFVHWIILNIPATTANLLASIPRLEQVSTPLGAVQGPNGFGEIGYSGPMPPAGSGKHRYVFTILAMDRVHVLDPNLSSEEFLKILDSSVLAKAELMGTYEIPALSIQNSNLVRHKGLAFAGVSKLTANSTVSAALNSLNLELIAGRRTTQDTQFSRDRRLAERSGLGSPQFGSDCYLHRLLRSREL